MREILIKRNESGQRLDKFLKKYLNNAPGSFLYKMLRKKNITLNGSKADGSEIINENDSIRLFLSDETIEKFRKDVSWNPVSENSAVDIEILYEDENILLVNKPAGILSQKASPHDVSINEIIIDYLVNRGKISIEDFSTFKPSVCNRLDRNTSGIITFGKTLKGTQILAGGLKERSIEKYYICAVNGVLKERAVINGFLKKDEKTNRVTINNKKSPENAEKISTEYLPVCSNGKMTLLKIKLHTGKTHQIRAHLASLGCPLIGDYKYGSAGINDRIKQKYGVKSQLLHAFEIFVPDIGKRIYAPIPEIMLNFLKGEHLWEPGNQEVLEDLH